jgi:hypothetical protein
LRHIQRRWLENWNYKAVRISVPFFTSYLGLEWFWKGSHLLLWGAAPELFKQSQSMVNTQPLAITQPSTGLRGVNEIINEGIENPDDKTSNLSTGEEAFGADYLKYRSYNIDEMSKRCPQKQLNDYIDKIIKEGTKELTHKLKNEAQKRNLGNTKCQALNPT